MTKGFYGIIFLWSEQGRRLAGIDDLKKIAEQFLPLWGF
jgi:hypothetical protein